MTKIQRRLIGTTLFIGLLAIIARYESGSLLLSGKPDINFYENGDLMWLIDKTMATKNYSRRTIEDYQKNDPEFVYKSYENYFNHINSHKEYRYHDWRIPTKEELLSLEYKGGWFRRIFISREKVKNDLLINTDIFYD